MLIDKIIIDKTFLEDTINKSWHDIENLQSQIDSLSTEDIKTAELKKLLNNLLTSYYVFAGCAENMLTNFDNVSNVYTQDIIEDNEVVDEEVSEIEPSESLYEEENIESLPENDDFEPFEYFVDFDDPVGEKITDADLY